MPRPDPLGHLRRLLDGPPYALPAPIDAIDEVWAGLSPRLRTLVRIAVVVAALAIAGRGATTSPWGPPVAAVSVASDLPAGHVLAGRDLDRVTWPRDLAGPDALDLPEVAIGRHLRVAVLAGTVLRAGHLSDGGPATGLTDGTVALAVPTSDLPGLVAGQYVDLLGSDGLGDPATLSRDAVVVEVGPTTTWIGVSRASAAAVASALAAGRLSVALIPAPS